MNNNAEGLGGMGDIMADTMLHLPRESIKAGKELVTETPIKALKTIGGIALSVVQAPLRALFRFPFLPSKTGTQSLQDVSISANEQFKTLLNTTNTTSFSVASGV